MGQIVIDDDFKDWEWFSDRNTLSVFMYLLLNANTEDKKDKGIDVPRGSVKTSVSEIANYFNMSAKEVRTAIKHINGANKVASKTFNKGTIFSIVEYDSYFVKGKQEGKQRANKGQAKGKQEEDKNPPQKRENYKQLFDRLIVNYNISNYVVDNGIRQWLKYKHERNGFHYKEIGMNTLLKKIEEKCRKYGDKAVVDIIEESISSSYQGIVFEKLERVDNNKKTAKQKQFDDFMQSIWEDEQNGS